jgi:hypothetical protein
VLEAKLRRGGEIGRSVKSSPMTTDPLLNKPTIKPNKLGIMARCAVDCSCLEINHLSEILDEIRMPHTEVHFQVRALVRSMDLV